MVGQVLHSIIFDELYAYSTNVSIFTLSSLVCVVFNPIDDTQLNYLYDDNLRIEPEWYCPVIPQKSCTSLE